jgi:hypothetical protein
METTPPDTKISIRLHHLSEDPHETKNLAEKHPEKVEAIRKKIEAWHAKNLEMRK